MTGKTIELLNGFAGNRFAFLGVTCPNCLPTPYAIANSDTVTSTCPASAEN